MARHVEVSHLRAYNADPRIALFAGKLFIYPTTACPPLNALLGAHALSSAQLTPGPRSSSLDKLESSSSTRMARFCS